MHTDKNLHRVIEENNDFAFSVKADVLLNSYLEAEGGSGVHSKKKSIRLKADSSSRQSEILINN